MSRHYDKLVRDRIPTVIEDDDEHPVTHVADDPEYERRLADKLCEEAAEFRESGDLEELADVREVIDAIVAHRGESEPRLAEIQRDKRDRRGGFAERIVLERVDGSTATDGGSTVEDDSTVADDET